MNPQQHPSRKAVFADLLRPLASLKLTVALLAMAMVLIFAGTTIQSERGIWDVQHQYFHSWFTIIDWRLFFPLWKWGFKNIPGAIPFPGGYTLIALLLANLLAAHTLRFKLSWKRSGVLLIHAGIILLLVGEIITSQAAIESQMTIDVGSSVNYASDSREVELAITDRSNPDHDVETVVPIARLRLMGQIQHTSLPFTLNIDRFYGNSDIAGPMQNSGGESLATTGAGVGLKLLAAPKASGTESSVDLPSSFVTLTSSSGEKLGTFLLSTIPLSPQFPQVSQPQSFTFDGKEYWLQLRFKRYYKPYTVALLKFSHDLYTGTDIPRNFSSLIRLTDPSQNVDREVLIWMNHPLRYAGETFYQSSFKPGDQTSILQVVHNPGWLIPYISCSMVALGLLIHFGIHLLGFLKRHAASSAASEDQPAEMTGLTGNGGKTGASGGGVAVMEPAVRTRRTRPARAPVSIWPAAIITGFCAIYLVSIIIPRSVSDSSSLDIDTFSRIPVTYEGRTMPLDSLARNSLRIISGKSELYTDEGTKPAITWLLDVFSRPDRAMNAKVFRIDHPDVLSLLGLDESRKLFSRAEINARGEKLEEQYQLTSTVDPKKRDLYQRKLMELIDHLLLFNNLASVDPLFLSPPLGNSKQWRSFGDAMKSVEQDKQRDPGAEAFLAMIQASGQNEPQQFNAIAAEYHNLIVNKMPGLSRKLDLEVVFNRAEPFIQCMVLYVIVFLLAAVSWLKWHRPLARAALWLLVLTLIFHTFGLVTRIYLQGRPPVTNLYSSAIFIAWAAVVFCVALELIYRNGVASATAAALAFPSLLIAHYLAGSGDTMQMMQAVLDTNIWLATHVVVVTLGYSATFLAGFLAIGYVLGGAFTSALDADTRKSFYRMVYGIVCFAMLFSFVGTVLGGIWADQSWGRFWGWDPKENGAVLIVLWNAILLHARWGGLVRERGFMNLAVGGNIVTAWSWFGTNMLGVGLHSYGFMDAAVFWLAGWVALQLIVIAIGLFPSTWWRSLNRPQARLAT